MLITTFISPLPCLSLRTHIWDTFWDMKIKIYSCLIATSFYGSKNSHLAECREEKAMKKKKRDKCACFGFSIRFSVEIYFIECWKGRRSRRRRSDEMDFSSFFSSRRNVIWIFDFFLLPLSPLQFFSSRSVFHSCSLSHNGHLKSTWLHKGDVKGVMDARNSPICTHRTA